MYILKLFLELLLILCFGGLIVLILVAIIDRIAEPVEIKEKEKEEEEEEEEEEEKDKITDEDEIAERVLLAQEREKMEKARKEVIDKRKLKEELKKPYLLYGIITKAWLRRENKYVGFDLDILGRIYKDQKIIISMSGNEMDSLPDDVSIQLFNIPGIYSYRYHKTLLELKDEEIAIIDKWIRENYTD